MTEGEEKLWLDNIQLRQQAHYYQSLHEHALAKQNEQAAQSQVLKAKVAELQKRLFGRKCERDFSLEAWVAKRRCRRRRGQQRGAPGHGRQCRDTLPVENVVGEATRQTGEWLMDETRWEVFVRVAGKGSHRWWVWVVVSAISRVYLLRSSRGARIDRGRDLAAPALPAPFVRMAAARLNTPEYVPAQQALVQKVEVMAQRRDEELAPPDLPAPRRKILASLREHWKGLTLLVDQPEIPMDNNGAERAGRPAALGRKNYYGSGSVWSGQWMAMWMTLFQTLAWHGIDDRGYLTAYREACAQNQGRVPIDLTPWLPWNFKAAAPRAPAPTSATARVP